VTISYEATDTGGSGLRTVDLYAKGPGEATFTKVASDSNPFDGEFTHAVDNGAYAFYTIATDHAGNVEAAPATPDATINVDTAGPESTSTSPAARAGNKTPITYTVEGGAEVETVDLYAKAPGKAAFSKVATDSSPDGAFTYRATAGDGTYAFYTVATDVLGAVEAAPTSADTKTRVDTVAPRLVAKMGGNPVRFDLGDKKPLELRMRVSERASVVWVIRRHGDVVRKLGWHDTGRGLVERKWFGRDADGDRIGRGRYALVMKAKDKAGNLTAVRMWMRVTR